MLRATRYPLWPSMSLYKLTQRLRNAVAHHRSEISMQSSVGNEKTSVMKRMLQSTTLVRERCRHSPRDSDVTNKRVGFHRKKSINAFSRYAAGWPWAGAGSTTPGNTMRMHQWRPLERVLRRSSHHVEQRRQKWVVTRGRMRTKKVVVDFIVTIPWGFLGVISRPTSTVYLSPLCLPRFNRP